MLNALHALKELAVFSVDVVDVDIDPQLVEQYDELVPVLTGQIDQQKEVTLCNYFLDEQAVYAFIASERKPGSDS